MDVMQACRCCLRCPPDKDLSTPYTHLGKREIYFDMLKDCFDLHLILDGAGSCGICSACVGRLRDASDFKLQVQRSQAELQATVLIKVEPEIKCELMDDDPTEDSAFDVLNEVPIDKTEIASEAETEKTEDPLTNAEKSNKLTSDQSVAAPERDGSQATVRRATAEGKSKQPAGSSNSYPHVDTTTHPYQCHQCQKRFKNETTLKNHLHLACDQNKPTHTSENPYKCNYCKHSFKFKSVLQAHERTHTGERPYDCSYCGYKSKHKSYLKSHMMIHTGEKPIKCSSCDYRCRREIDLRRHAMIHTGEKPHTCSYCGFKSSDWSNMQAHQMTHTEEKPLKCSYCDYKCRRKTELKSHLRRHTGEKPIKCSNCDYTCRNSSSLRWHLKSKHSGEKS